MIALIALCRRSAGKQPTPTISALIKRTLF
jgi:hypothetical protein